jgi:hypothetical protein
MRRLALVLLALAASFTRAAAQDAPRALTADAARRVVGFYDDPSTLRLNGAARIPAASTIRGNVAALDGDLTIAGRIEGDVVVINGDAVILPGAEVTGRLTVAGGAARVAPGAHVGEVAAYADRVDYLRRGERIYAEIGGRTYPDPTEVQVAAAPDTVRDAERPWSAPDSAAAPARARARDEGMGEGEMAGDDEGWSVRHAAVGQGRADFIVATGQSYNRVEGLPITVGPVLETAGRNPLRLRAMGIFRTESGPELGPERWGYDARLEQFFGGRREFRVGGTVYRRIDPIEDWHLTKLENGLSTFFLHRDYRDHFERQGASAFLAVTPAGSPFAGMLEMRRETERPEPAGSPFALLDNSEPWRPQPLAAAGRLESLVLSGRVDTRSTATDPASGWYVRGEVEEGIHSRLRQPDYVTGYDPTSSLPVAAIPGKVYGSFTSGLLDVRRYNRIGPWSRLNLRVIAGGSLDGSPMPPQRQHALGGEGSLPGFPLFSLDCGARDFRVYRVSEIAKRVPTPEHPLNEYFPQYGCDRFALFQAEYRGDLRFRLHWGGDDADGGEGEGWARAAIRNGLNTDFAWVLFADAGRGWTLDDSLEGTGAATDVGAGVIVGRLGVYGAVPVSTGGRFNLFIRLSPRI